MHTCYKVHSLGPSLACCKSTAKTSLADHDLSTGQVLWNQLCADLLLFPDLPGRLRIVEIFGMASN